MNSRPIASLSRGLVFGLFFFSGVSALIYQVVWTRLMGHVFGTTLLAISTVLAAFMTGLALGSFLLGRRADRHPSPLRLYAWYEIGIGLTGLGVLLILDQLAPVQVALSRYFGSTSAVFAIVRFALVFVLILVPTTLMGATLPILSRWIIGTLRDAGRLLGGLYAINTIGAVGGCLLAGFYLIGTVGTHHSIHLAAGINLGIGLVSWWFSRGGKASSSVPDKISEQDPPATGTSVLSPATRRLLLIGFALSGTTAFAFEVFWTRALIFYVGNSTYAVTTMLTAFLVGISLGGLLSRFWVDRSKAPVRLFAAIQIGIGLSAAAAMPLLGRVMESEGFQQWYESTSGHWNSLLWARFLVCFLAMLVPATLIGTTFPLVGKILLRDLDSTGETIGRAYAVNTLGNIAGALLPAFLILPLLGIHKGIFVMAAVNLWVGIGLWLHLKSPRRFPRILAGAAALASFVLLFRLPSPSPFPSDTQEPDDPVLYYREGPVATTKVFVNSISGDKRISVDGIQIGGTDFSVDYKQQWLAHLPKLLVENPRKELSIGLGSGILAGESVRHPTMERVTCVEIAPTVVEAAHDFGEENHGVMHSPKLDMVTSDGINYLLTSNERYDIITTDGKTEPEYSVNGTFFTWEYYTLMRDHLAEGGVAVQWIPTHYPPRIFRTAIHTCAGVFPHVQLWFADGNAFMVASRHEIPLDAAEIDRRLADSDLPFDGLRKYGLKTAASLLSHLVAAEDVLRAATAEMPVNSFEHPVIEFFRSDDFAGSSADRERRNLEFLLPLRGTGRLGPRLAVLPEEVGRAWAAQGIYLEALRALLSGESSRVVEPLFTEALEASGNREDLRLAIYGHYLQTMKDLAAMGKWDRVAHYGFKATSIWGASAEAYHLWGISLFQTGEIRDGIKKFEISVRLDPSFLASHRILADVRLQNQQPLRAIPHLRAILDRLPDDVPSLIQLGQILSAEDRLEEAVAILQRAYALSPRDPEVVDAFGWALHRHGNFEKARTIIQKSDGVQPTSPAMSERRERILSH